jgi:uncharacterized protein YydD (DUF2326 family)
MVRRIYSSDPAFRTIEFRSGFNLLVAEKAPRATELQSRNGAGKSSFVRLVHFLLGGSCKKGECMFLDPLLRDHFFGMEFDLGGETIAVERSAARATRVYFSKLPRKRWPIHPRARGRDQRPSLSNEEWKTVLGSVMFGLRVASDDERAEKFIPTFRTLFPYFSRLHEDGAFLEPTQVFTKQQLWNQQVAIAFLLGLDWRIPQGMQLVRARERTLRQLQEIVKSDESGLFPRSDDLQAQLTLAQDRVAHVKQSLAGYQINPEYHVFEAEANRLTTDIASSLDEDVWDREQVTGLEQALRAEVPPEPVDLQRLYDEAQVELPGSALRRFDEVRVFHESVIRNRQSYLQAELKAAKERLDARARNRKEWDTRRAQVMAVLSSTGALEQFTQLQSELGRVEGHAENLRRQTAAARQMEQTRLELDIEAAELELRLGRNHEEQRERIEEAQLIFAHVSRSLYEESGTLTVNNKLSGPPVRATIHGQESVGIQKMQIYCFDVTIMRMSLKQAFGPGFLIHDSHLFDGVDPRQVRHALASGITQASEHGFQYIVTMNSDKVAAVGEAGLDMSQYTLGVRLTDQPTGGLFGKRFG